MSLHEYFSFISCIILVALVGYSFINYGIILLLGIFPPLNFYWIIRLVDSIVSKLTLLLLLVLMELPLLRKAINGTQLMNTLHIIIYEEKYRVLSTIWIKFDSPSDRKILDESMSDFKSLQRKKGNLHNITYQISSIKIKWSWIWSEYYWLWWKRCHDLSWNCIGGGEVS